MVESFPVPFAAWLRSTICEHSAINPPSVSSQLSAFTKMPFDEMPPCFAVGIADLCPNKVLNRFDAESKSCSVASSGEVRNASRKAVRNWCDCVVETPMAGVSSMMDRNRSWYAAFRSSFLALRIQLYVSVIPLPEPVQARLTLSRLSISPSSPATIHE